MPTRPNSYVPPAEELRRALAWAEPGDLGFFARQCLERGGFDQVLALADAFEGQSEANPALELCRAIAHFVGGERERGLELARALSRTRPSYLNALAVLGEMQARSGDSEAAKRSLLGLVERYPDYPGAQGTLASLVMPGPYYREVLDALHRRVAPKAYLEVGVETGATLALARTAEVAVGIDPAPSLEHALPPGAKVMEETSDAFFGSRTRASVFGELRVELAFIDGMHLFEFALRDFINVEAWSSPDGTIVLHDCLPLVRIAAERERKTRFWVGDTWKAALAIARHRPELRIRTVLTPPSGLVVIRGLDPDSTLLREHYSAIVEEFSVLAYPCPTGEFPEELAPVPATPAGLSEALG